MEEDAAKYGFVHLESVHQKLSRAHHKKLDLFSDARESGLETRYATISHGFPLDHDRDSRPEQYWTASDATASRRRVRREINPVGFALPPLLVADTVYLWPAAIARMHDLANVAFYTSPALVFSLTYHLDLLKERGHFLHEDDDGEIDYVPGVRPIRIRDLMTSLSRRDDIKGNNIFKASEEVKKADFNFAEFLPLPP